MSKTVKYRVDTASMPPLTAKQKAELAALAVMPDSQIDTSDIAPLNKTTWDSSTRGRFYKSVKTSTTIRVDADVLAWLKAQGKGYQTRINAILRHAMLHAISRKA